MRKAKVHLEISLARDVFDASLLASNENQLSQRGGEDLCPGACGAH